MKNLDYLLHSGKNSKFKYYVVSVIRCCTPRCLLHNRLRKILNQIDARADREYILDRVDYYNRLDPHTSVDPQAQQLCNHKLKSHHSAYFFDSYEFTRWFDNHYLWSLLSGDITYVPDYPSVVKSRPIHGDNRNSILLNLDKVRHFVFLHDKIPFRAKSDRVIFRGDLPEKPNSQRMKPNRQRFLDLYGHHPMCDAGDTAKVTPTPPELCKPPISLYNHLKYKFVMSLEGNDVASNLKWVMSSNSIAVMPRPTYETWFMEGRLIPNFHYIEIRPDFSDLEERLRYYIDHPEEAEAIIRNANEYVRQFFDRDRERLISLLVLQKYFERTGQTAPSERHFFDLQTQTHDTPRRSTRIEREGEPVPEKI